DKGNMAVVGKNYAVLERGWLRTSGFLTWLVWAFVHILSLPQLQNRLRVQRQWLWSYFTGQRSSRLIPEPPRTPGADARYIRRPLPVRAASGRCAAPRIDDAHGLGVQCLDDCMPLLVKNLPEFASINSANGRARCTFKKARPAATCGFTAKRVREASR